MLLGEVKGMGWWGVRVYVMVVFLFSGVAARRGGVRFVFGFRRRGTGEWKRKGKGGKCAGRN